MTIKVFKANNQGKIELTQAELEKLLNEVYDSGYKEGKQSVSINIPSTQPYWGWRDGITTTGTLGNGNIALLSDKTTATSDAITGTTTTTKTNMSDAIKLTAKTMADSGLMNSKELGTAVESILRNFAATRSCPVAGSVGTSEAKATPFTNLQKELANL